MPASAAAEEVGDVHLLEEGDLVLDFRREQQSFEVDYHRGRYCVHAEPFRHLLARLAPFTFKPVGVRQDLGAVVVFQQVVDRCLAGLH